MGCLKSAGRIRTQTKFRKEERKEEEATEEQTYTVIVCIQREGDVGCLVKGSTEKEQGEHNGRLVDSMANLHGKKNRT